MKKIVIAASGLLLIAMTACNKAEMPVPQTSTAHTSAAAAREIGAGPKQAPPISIAPPKPDR